MIELADLDGPVTVGVRLDHAAELHALAYLTADDLVIMLYRIHIYLRPQAAGKYQIIFQCFHLNGT